MAEYVFRVTKAINEFNAPAGSFIVYRPGNPVAEFQVVQSAAYGGADALLKHSAHLHLVSQDPPVQAESPFLRALQQLQTRKQA